MAKDFCGIINNVCDLVNCGDCFEFITFNGQVITNKEEEKVMKNTKTKITKKQVEAQLTATKVELIEFATLATEFFGSVQLLSDALTSKSIQVDELESKLVLARDYYRDNEITITELKKKLNLARDFYRTLEAERDAWMTTAMELAGKNQQALVAAKKRAFTKLPKVQQDRLNTKIARGGNAVTTPTTSTAPATRAATIITQDWRNVKTSLILTKEVEAATSPVEVPCEICGQFNVKPNVANYSLRKFDGKVFCRTCQVTVKKVAKSIKPAVQENTTAPLTQAVGDDIVF